jgi:transcriptional regulator with XRE-family HTH domain
MDAAVLLRSARRTAGLSLRGLAAAAGTSHPTLAAYEAGTKVPRADTLDRILRAAGFAPIVDLARRPDATDTERVAKGEELEAVLRLAARFPARHDAELAMPNFGHAA